MLITISGKNIEVSEYLREVIKKKMKKLDRYFKEDTKAQVTLSMQRSMHIVEVTIYFDSVVIRGEEATGDMYASIDNVLDKLEKQIERYRTKLGKRLREGAFDQTVPDEGREVEQQGSVVRQKSFYVKPMSVDEAAMQMELLGHEFYVFANLENEKICVLYRRKDGNYGLLIPEVG